MRQTLPFQAFWLGLILTLTILTFKVPANAQSLDSLFRQHTNKEGKVDIARLLPVGKPYIFTQPDKAYAFARRLITVAQKQGEPLNMAHCYRFLGAYFTDAVHIFDSAAFYYRKAETLYRREGFDQGVGAMMHNYAVLEHYKGNYARAAEFALEAVRILQPTGDTETIHKTYNNLSTIYAYMKDYKHAEIYALESIKRAEALGDHTILAYARIALIDALLGQRKGGKVPVLLKEVYEGIKDLNNKNLMMSYHFNSGNYHIQIHKDYKRAIPYFSTVRKLAQESSNSWELLRTEAALADAYENLGDYSQAYAFAQESLKGARALDIPYYIELNLAIIARCEARLNHFKSAFNQLNTAYLLRDTLFNEEQQRQITFLEASFQKERKDLKIQALEKQQQLYMGLGIAGVIVFISILAFAIIRYRLAVNRRKLAEKEALRLEQEKQLVAVQATLDGEAAERSRLAKDLHDGLGSMLSLVKFNLPELKGEAVLEAIDVSRFRKALGMLDDSIHELRRVAHHMMPESLLRYGLKTSLSDFCNAIPMVQFHYFGDESRLADKLEIMIYRCIHELVNNALKHARATHINVQLVQEHDRVSFTIQDDGIGFKETEIKEGMGIKNVRQRVTAFHGEMHIYSSEQGTEIHIEIDITNHTPHD